MLLLLAVVPLDVILSGANVLSVLAQTVTLLPFFFLLILIMTSNLKFSLGDVGFEHGLLSMLSSFSVEEF